VVLELWDPMQLVPGIVVSEAGLLVDPSCGFTAPAIRTAETGKLCSSLCTSVERAGT
jgi:hypothetical protein